MSTPAEHTPGPWEIEKHRSRKGTYALISAAGWGEFAKVIVRMNGADHDCADGLANARLIASAPDLLAALIEAEAFIAHTNGGGETDFRAKLNAAIAKATPVLEREGE